MHNSHPSDTRISNTEHIMRYDANIIKKNFSPVIRKWGKFIFSSNRSFYDTFPSNWKIFMIDRRLWLFTIPIEINWIIDKHLRISHEVFIIMIISFDTITIWFFLISQNTFTIFRSIICISFFNFINFNL